MGDFPCTTSEKCCPGWETLDMTSEGLGEMFMSLMAMGGRVEDLACTEPGAKTPIRPSGINLSSLIR